MLLTIDSIWSDRIRLAQSKRGYRFTLDALLLAHYLRAEPTEDVLEIGAGNGVIAVLFSRLQKFNRLVAIEVQSELAELCNRNFQLNGLTNTTVREADLKNLPGIVPLHSFDLIYSNPPYRKLGTGKLNPSSEKAIARHEVRMRLEDLFQCAQQLLKTCGRLSVILPEFREADFDKLVREYKMVLRERRYVHSFASEPPSFFLATVCRGKPQARLARPSRKLQPLVIYDAPGRYTPELQRLLRM